MSSFIFQITQYKCVLYNEVHRRIQNMDIQYNSIITLRGNGNKSVNIFFISDSSPMPQPFINSANNIGTMYVRASRYSEYVDLLRNEKPLFLEFYSGKSAPYCNIRTYIEPVGEGE